MQAKGITRITPATFEFLLHKYNSPVTNERPTREYYYLCTQYAVDPSFILGMFLQESTMGKFGLANESHSWGNTTAPPNFGPNPAVPPEQYLRGRFPIYANWKDGLESTLARLTSPEWVYTNLNTVEDIITKWAPPTDNNHTQMYISNVESFMNTNQDIDPPRAIPAGGESVDWNISAGLRAAMQENNDQPRGHEVFYNDNYSVTPGTKYLYTAHKIMPSPTETSPESWIIYQQPAHGP